RYFLKSAIRVDIRREKERYSQSQAAHNRGQAPERRTEVEAYSPSSPCSPGKISPPLEPSSGPPSYVLIWDLDEILIVFNSLSNNSNSGAGTFNFILRNPSLRIQVVWMLLL